MSIRTLMALLLALAASVAAPAAAETLPPVETLKARIGAAPSVVRVYEPHLSTAAAPVAVAYVGYPAELVLAALFGAEWRSKAATIEFHALDGYVSRVPAARFAPGKAFIVFARADGRPFTVDNVAQNERDVPLGPYYLVWENVADAAARAEGARHWPYQVTEIVPSTASDSVLTPPGLDPRLRGGAALAATHCLSCHQVNGYGGRKFPANLAEIARAMEEPDFTAWLLAPSSRRKDTTMPALAPRLPEAERRRVARALFEYLRGVPVVE
ncbi:MAG: cytochrome c family protein [Rhodospirillales bacterium]|nr:MAG: cytochrome c family protein [Rhodospirillales bacterium]